MKFAHEIASAVLCLHENDIIHRDLHSNNLLVHQETIKLTDFGLSRKILQSTTTSSHQLAGILPYFDPRCFKANKPDKKSDVYSVGVLLWELTNGKPPFINQDQVTLMFNLLQGMREESIPNTPDEYVNLYKECWQDEPENRPDIRYVEKILIEMISGSNIVDNDGQRKNKDNSSFNHSNTILAEPTSIDLLQKNYDELVEQYDS